MRKKYVQTIIMLGMIQKGIKQTVTKELNLIDLSLSAFKKSRVLCGDDLCQVEMVIYH